MRLIEVSFLVACEGVCKSNFWRINVVEHDNCLSSL